MAFWGQPVWIYQREAAEQGDEMAGSVEEDGAVDAVYPAFEMAFGVIFPIVSL